MDGFADPADSQDRKDSEDPEGPEDPGHPGGSPARGLRRRRVELLQGLARRRAEELSLVLTARQVGHRLRDDPAGFAIEVAPRDLDRSRRELASYLEENENWPPRENPAPPAPDAGIAAFTVIVLLVCAYRVQTTSFLGIDWEGIGLLAGAAVREGEVWRCFTALLLHADVRHLVSNCVFGAALVAGLAQILGAGPAFLLTLLAGGFGNAVSVLIRDETYLALGASTAVFGACGVLVGYRVAARDRRGLGRLQRYAPAIAGLALFSQIGVGGERTDVLAHVLGLLCGGWIGALVGRVGATPFAARKARIACGIVALALLVTAVAVAAARADR